MKPIVVMAIIIATLIGITVWQKQRNSNRLQESSRATDSKQEAVNVSRGMHKQQPVVVILNGPSASGKSSIQKEFQSLMMPNLWIKLGIDNLFDKPMPDITLANMSFWQQENTIRWIDTTKDQENNSVITLHTGPQGQQVAYGMNSAIVAYAQAGCNAIVDYIAYEKDWTDDLQRKLNQAGIKTYWIKITIPLSILEQREITRATSPKGHARSHYNFVYHDISYDLELDTSKLTPQECAQKILAMLYNKSK